MTPRSIGEIKFAKSSVASRCALLERFRHRLVEQKDELLEYLSELRPQSSRGELLTTEFIPLLDNCRFLEAQSKKLLASKKLGRWGQPAWLWGVESVIHREALGRVLVVSPSNYPLFLPMVCAVYALAAGNSVWVKPAPGSSKLHHRVRQAFLAAGADPDTFKVLQEDHAEVEKALRAGIHKLVLIGSAETGRVVLSQAAEALVSTTAELSGWDAVFIHHQADYATAAQSLAFSLGLNGGRTCVAPRRIFFQGELAQFESQYLKALSARTWQRLTPQERQMIDYEQSRGARYLCQDPDQGGGILITSDATSELWSKPHFGSIALLTQVANDEEALQISRECRYALGATLFGPDDWAQSLAHKVPAQVVCIHDALVPTADPRVPFGGSGWSGWGRMRGAEGLLEMTQTRTVCTRKGGSTDHLSPPSPHDDQIVETFLLLSHSSGLSPKLKALAKLIATIAKERRRKRLEKKRS